MGLCAGFWTLTAWPAGAEDPRDLQSTLSLVLWMVQTSWGQRNKRQSGPLLRYVCHLEHHSQSLYRQLRDAGAVLRAGRREGR